MGTHPPKASAVAGSAAGAIVGKDLDGIVTNWSAGAERLFGYTAEEIVGKSVRILIPPDRQNEEDDILAHIRRGEDVQRDGVRRKKDGSPVEVSLSVVPVKNGQRGIAGAVKIARDRTEQRRAHERQQALLGEMNHRIKNLFVVTDSLLALIAPSVRTPKELADAVRDRLYALSRAHDLVRLGTADTGETIVSDTTLKGLVRAVCAPYDDASRRTPHPRIAVSGPEVVIGIGAITPVVLVLHELATNAVKHGALSIPQGHVRVAWTVKDGELHINWRERDGPRVADAPQSLGFGGATVRGVVTYQLGGDIFRAWNPEGLTARISIPLDRLGASG